MLEQVRTVLTGAQVAAIEEWCEAVAPIQLSGVQFDVVTGVAEVAFGDEVRFRVAADGQISSVAPPGEGVGYDQALAIRKQLVDLQATVLELTNLVRMYVLMEGQPVLGRRGTLHFDAKGFVVGE